MRLHFLEPTSRTAVNVARLRKYGYETRRIIAEVVKSLDTLVVIANGTPDDMVLGVLSHHLDGDRVVGVTKPENTGLSVLDQLKVYVPKMPKINKFMVLLDQEDLPLSKLFDDAFNGMERMGMAVSLEEEISRVGVYRCVLAGKGFEVIVVVSGLDEVGTEKHTIEDHLVKAAGLEAGGSSKDCWDSLGSDERGDVFRRLRGEGGIMELFRQQVIGLERLRREC